MRLTDNAAYRAFIAAATIFFLFLIFFSHTFLKNKQQLEEQKNLEVILADFSLRAIERIQAAVENLRGVSLIVAFDENPNFEQFQSYTLEYLGDSANWLVIEWQPIVKSQERSSFEAYVQEHIFPEFKLWEMDSSGNTVPATDREEHVPVLFMVSNTPAIDTTGLDLAWSEERMESKWQARDYGQARMSQLFNVVLSQEETSGPLGFAVTLPVFQDAIIPKSPQLRKQKIKGYIAGVYALEALLAEELNALKKQGYRVEIADQSCPEVCFHWPDTNSTASSTIESNMEVVSLYGRQWEIRIEGIEDELAAYQLKLWIVIPFCIGVFAIAFLLIVRWLHNNNKELLRIESALQETLQRVRTSEQNYAEQARRDPLTGLLNRRSFFALFEEELARTERYAEALTLLLFDIDDFKHINDTYGHPTGDRVLKKLADTCQTLARQSDLICRFGGEEFAILFTHTSATEGLQFAERFRERIADIKVIGDETNATIQFTVSGGIASYAAGDSTRSLLLKADKALYYSKHHGKNKISVAQD